MLIITYGRVNPATLRISAEQLTKSLREMLKFKTFFSSMIIRLAVQSWAFPLLEMFCSADENKLLSNQSVNLGSRDARPYYVAIIWLIWQCNCEPSENDIFSSVLNCNNPTGLFTLIRGRVNACRKTHIALTSPRRSCDETFVSLLVAARVISS